MGAGCGDKGTSSILSKSSSSAISTKSFCGEALLSTGGTCEACGAAAGDTRPVVVVTVVGGLAKASDAEVVPAAGGGLPNKSEALDNEETPLTSRFAKGTC